MQILEFKSVIDVGAHYSHPDVLQLHVNRCPLEGVVLTDASASPGDDDEDGSGLERRRGGEK